MGTTIINAAPQSRLLGIKDESSRSPVYETEAVPTHLPHVYLYARKGPTMPQLVSGDSLVTMYDSRTFDYRDKYANHQTVLANTVNAEGNQIMVQRLRPLDANPNATLRLSVDVMHDQVPQYERDVYGRYILDQNGAKVPTGKTVSGRIYRWLTERVGEEELGQAEVVEVQAGEVTRITEAAELRITEDGEVRIVDNELGQASVKLGSMVSSTGGQSLIYPIMEFEVMDFGEYGNNVGVRFSAPTTESPIPIDDATVMDQLAYLYRLQLVERKDEGSTPVVVETLHGEQFMNFAFKDDVVNERTDQDLSLNEIFMETWNQEAAGGYPQIRGPIGDYHVYDEYLEELLWDAMQVEAEYGLVPLDQDAMHLMNIFTGHDYNAVPYYALQVVGPTADGIMLTSNSTHYARGGSDGTMTFQLHDDEVRRQLENFGDLEADLLDTAYWPQSVFYDTGFTLPTKKMFGVPLGRRKDVYVVVSTQDLSYTQNTPSEETSIATSLRTALRMYPESEVYGTSTCRAIILGHSGYLTNSNYKELLPLTIEFAQRCAAFMGASTGVWNSGQGFDKQPNNQIKMFRGVNAPFKKSTIRNRDWETGLVWAQNYDRRSLFWPAIQTVYDDDSSVLNAAINMMVAVELEKVADRTWRDLTGVSYLTNEQFIQRSNEMIEERTRKRFDGRVIIEADTFFTANDTQRGYSWSCNIHMYAPNMKTVGTFTIVAHRREDYVA